MKDRFNLKMTYAYISILILVVILEKSKSHEVEDSPMNPMTNLEPSQTYPYMSGQAALGHAEREPLNAPSSNAFARVSTKLYIMHVAFIYFISSQAYNNRTLISIHLGRRWRAYPGRSPLTRLILIISIGLVSM